MKNFINKFMLCAALISGYSTGYANTVVLSNSAVNSCIYSSMAVTANGDVIVSCTGDSVPVVTPPVVVPPVTVPTNCSIKNITWPMGPTRINSDPYFNMPDGQSFAFKVTMPDRGAVISSLAYSATGKFLAISTKPCVFDEVTSPACSNGNTNKPLIRNSTTGGNFCHLQPNTVYYFNVKHGSTAYDRSTCIATASDTCSYYLQW